MLTSREYDNLLRAALVHEGLMPDQAEHLIQARWPMDGHGAIHEANGRGWHLDETAVADFLETVLGEPCDLGEVRMTDEGVDALLTWAETHGRGRPTFEGLAYHDRLGRREGSLCN